MFKNKEKTFRILVTTSRQIGLYKNIQDNKIILGDSIDVPWQFLKTTSFRREKLELICNECGKEFCRRLEHLNENDNIHYCSSCRQRGEKNYNYGKPIHPNTRKGLVDMLLTNNPSKKLEVRKKISDAKKGKPSNNPNGIKSHTDETKNKISESLKILWKEGKFNKLQNTFGQTNTEIYKNIEYQGSYELNFLKYIENLGYLNYIERGPKIKYIDKDGNNKIYFSDFRLKNSNIIFEIKSTYFLNLHKENYILKEIAAKTKYNYILILDNNFDNLIEKIKEYNG